MPGRVPSSDGPWPGTGSDQHYVPLSQTTCFLLSFSEGRSGMLFANVCGEVPFGFWTFFGLLDFFFVSCAYGEF